MKRIALLSCSLLIILTGCNSREASESVQYCNDSLKIQQVISITSSDKILNSAGSIILVAGFFSYGMEDVALYPADPNSTSGALWLNLLNKAEWTSDQLESLNGKKVLVAGRVNLKNKGHVNGYLASLDSVFCLQPQP